MNSSLLERGLQCYKDNGFSYTIKRVGFRCIKKIYSKLPGYEAYHEKSSLEKEHAYISYLEKEQFNRYNGISEKFTPLSDSDYVRTKDSPKIIAWYLPQFYQMDVNNKYHGQGFTEWTNTTQTMPQFTGHYQPHVPYDVGYYDLTNVETLKRQAHLANKYGVYGFCFHWYWFSGERTMEVPPKLLLKHPEIDIHYCFDWATENWTSAWDGGTKEVIFEQKIQEGDAVKLIADLLPFFKDPRYIKIDGKPVLSIYRCDMFDKEIFLKFVREMRKVIKLNGFPDLYLMLTNRAFEGNVREWGLDALVEFPPCFIYGLSDMYKPDGYINPNFKADFFNIDKFVDTKAYYRNYDSNDYYRSVLVSFDNSARRATTGCQIMMNDPEHFESWLKGCLLENDVIHTNKNNFVFINSWNEWAEGSHLEPDMRYGYSYLQAVKNSLEDYREIDTGYVDREVERAHNVGDSLVFYIHSVESLGDIVASEPIVRYLHKTYPQSIIKWIIRKEYKDLIIAHPLIDEIIEVECLGDSIEICKKLQGQLGRIVIDCHYDKRPCVKTYKIHENKINPQVNEKTYLYYGSLLKSFCYSAGIPALDDSPRFYLSSSVSLPCCLPDSYIVFHCTSAESTKDWPRNKWNELAEKLLKSGFYIVEVGLTPVIEIKSNMYYDMTNINDLQSIANIIKNSSCFVGIDSGFAHIANCFDIHGVLIFGKYKNFRYPQMYSGKYATGETAEIIYAENKPAAEVAVSTVYSAICEYMESI